ncbi:hypothetical protein ACVMFA_008118 [Bradyrhizobium liaoningense]
MAAIDKRASASLDAMAMLASLGLILLCQLIGEAVVRGLGLPLGQDPCSVCCCFWSCCSPATALRY